MFNKLRMAWRTLSNSLPVAKAHSNLSIEQIPIRLGSQLAGTVLEGKTPHPPLREVSSNFRLSPNEPLHPYWISFRDPEDNFVGVVICRGKTPGAAANSAIVRGIVESERANIILISELQASLMASFMDRLLDEKSAMLAAEAGGFELRRDSKES